MELIYKEFSSHAEKTLSSFFNLPITVTFNSFEQMSLCKYLYSLSNTSNLALSSMLPLKGSCLLEVSTMISRSAINVMLGGDPDVPSFSHPLNNLETAINRKFMDILFDQLHDAWAPYLNISFILTDFLKAPIKITSIPCEDSYLAAFFDITWKSAKGTMSIALPSTCLESVKEQLPLTEAAPLPQQEVDLSDLCVPLRAVLGRTKIPSKEIQQLQPGDVLLLDQEAGAPIEIMLNKESVCKGIPGLKGNHKAILIRAFRSVDYDA